MTDRTVRRHLFFTLIELLVVVSIIGILVSLLMPALTRVKRSAQNAVCISNMKQNTMALVSYANDFNGSMPLHPNYATYGPGCYSGGGRDLRVVKDYVGTFELWTCPFVNQEYLIDDPKNTSIFRSNIRYWPGYDRFFSIRTPQKIRKQNADDYILTDEGYTYGGAWRTNHNQKGDFVMFYPSNNPAFVTYRNGAPWGMNTSYADGSARSYGPGSLVSGGSHYTNVIYLPKD